MTGSPEPRSAPSLYADEQAMTWMREHAADLRRSVYGQRILYWSLAIAFVVGLAAHIGGYFLLSPTATGFLGLLAELLYALGWSLWTGVIVALFIQVIPEVKRRQIKTALDAYEAAEREKAKADGEER